MARLSYAAPGVYVEEVASARQPIAGVGTNTVAFIGIVPDKIYIPRASTKYDPVKAMESALDRATATREFLKKSLPESPISKDESADLERKLKSAGDEVKARTKTRDDAKDARTALAAGAPETKAADKALTDAEDALSKSTQAHAELDQRAKAKKSETKSTGESETAEFPLEPDYVLKSSEDRPENHPIDRPYYFTEFDIEVEEFATKLCTNFSEYAALFGDFSGFTTGVVTDDADAMWRFRPLSPGHHMLTHAVSGFFKNGGTRCFVARIRSEIGLAKALERFESIDEVAIIAAPGLPKSTNTWGALQDHCENQNHPNVFAILDSPGIVGTGKEIEMEMLLSGKNFEGFMPRDSKYAALYFPYIEVNDPAKRLQDEDPARGIATKYRGLTYVPPSGHMAGVYARTDEERGVHKAPANAVLRGALEVKYYVSKARQELLNPQGINCLRIIGGGVVAWGARTIGGDRNGEWKYINVRRFAGFLEESIDEGTQWVVFEPNDPALWSKIRLNLTAFLTNVWRNGALFGLTPEDAFYVKCDAELNPPEVRDLGQVVTEIGVAIVRPAEFVIFRISQSSDAQQS